MNTRSKSLLLVGNKTSNMPAAKLTSSKPSDDWLTYRFSKWPPYVTTYIAAISLNFDRLTVNRSKILRRKNVFWFGSSSIHISRNILLWQHNSSNQNRVAPHSHWCLVYSMGILVFVVGYHHPVNLLVQLVYINIIKPNAIIDKLHHNWFVWWTNKQPHIHSNKNLPWLSWSATHRAPSDVLQAPRTTNAQRY